MKESKLTTTQLAAVLAVMSVISKLLGFVRELFLTNYFGANYVTDAYIMSMSIPNNLLASIVGSAMTAYMPVFSRKVEQVSLEEGHKFTSQIVSFLACATTAAAVLGCIFAKQLVALFAPGFTGETAALTVFYTRIAFVMIIFSVFSQVLGALLQYKGVFIFPNLFSYIQNILIITAIIVSAKTSIPQLLIFGIATAYGVTALGNILLSGKHGYTYKFVFNFSESVKDVVAMAVPIFVGSSVGELNAFIDRMLASDLVEGSVSALNYGTLFSNIVSSFTVTIFLTIIYPRLTKAFAENNLQRVSDLAERGINVIVLLMLPMTLGAMIYSRQVVQVVFERGAFSEQATELTATAFFYYAIAMAFNGIRDLIGKLFYANHDTRTPVICSVVGICINIVLNLILVKTMAHGGLALATSISQIVNTILMYILFVRQNPGITLLTSYRKIIKIIFFSVISCGISYAFYHYVGNAVWMPRMVLLGLAVAVACVIYLLFLYLAHFEELSLIKDLFAKGKKEA